MWVQDMWSVPRRAEVVWAKGVLISVYIHTHTHTGGNIPGVVLQRPGLR